MFYRLAETRARELDPLHSHLFDALSKEGKRSIQQVATHRAYETRGMRAEF